MLISKHLQQLNPARSVWQINADTPVKPPNQRRIQCACTAVIAAKMGRSQSIDNPQMIALEKLMMQYFPADFKLETNANLDLCGKIFANNLSKIEFEVTND